MSNSHSSPQIKILQRQSKLLICQSVWKRPYIYSCFFGRKWLRVCLAHSKNNNPELRNSIEGQKETLLYLWEKCCSTRLLVPTGGGQQCSAHTNTDMLQWLRCSLSSASTPRHWSCTKQCLPMATTKWPTSSCSTSTKDSSCTPSGVNVSCATFNPFHWTVIRSTA